MSVNLSERIRQALDERITAFVGLDGASGVAGDQGGATGSVAATLSGHGRSDAHRTDQGTGEAQDTHGGN